MISFRHLALASVGLVAGLAALPASAQGTLSVNSGTVSLGTGVRLQTTYNLSVATGATLQTGAPATGGTLVLNGTTDQTVTSATAIGNVTFDKSAGAVVLGSDLAVTGVLTPGATTLTPGAFALRLAPTVENGAIVRLAALAGDGSTTPVTFERPHLNGRGWRMIAAPLTSTFQSLNDDFHTQGAPGATYPFGGAHLFSWFPSVGVARYTAVPNFANPFQPGRGYVFDAYATAPGTGTPILPTVWDMSGTEPTGTVAVALGYSTADADAAFNLLGNPYAAPLDWHAVQAAGGFTATYAVWDPAANGGASGSYAYYSSAGVSTGDANRYIPVTQGFWAEATAASPTTLTFDRAWKAPTGAPLYVGRGADSETAQLRFALTGAGLTATEPVALFLDGGLDGPDLYDATWMEPLSADYAAAYFVRADDGRALVFEARPTNTEPTLRLAVEATRSGSYTLSWPALDAAPSGLLTLVDLITGEQTDLRTATSYTFTLDAQRSAGDVRETGELPVALARTAAPRFEITVGRAVTAGEAEATVTELALDAARPNPTSGTTRLSFALPEGGPVRLAVVDLLGRTVAVVADRSFGAGRHDVTFDASRLSAGVYALRLDAAGTVRTGRLTVAR